MVKTPTGGGLVFVKKDSLAFKVKTVIKVTSLADEDF